MGRGSQNIRLSLFTFLSKNFLHVGYLQLYYTTFLFFNKCFIFKKTEILAKYKDYKNHKIEIKL